MQNNETFELSFNHKRDKTSLAHGVSRWSKEVVLGLSLTWGPLLRLLSVHYLQLCFLTKAIFLWGVFLCGEKIKQTKPVMTSTSQKRVTYKILIKMLLLAHEHPKGRDAIQSSALCNL